MYVVNKGSMMVGTVISQANQVSFCMHFVWLEIPTAPRWVYQHVYQLSLLLLEFWQLHSQRKLFKEILLSKLNIPCGNYVLGWKCSLGSSQYQNDASSFLSYNSAAVSSQTWKADASVLKTFSIRQTTGLKCEDPSPFI